MRKNRKNEKGKEEGEKCKGKKTKKSYGPLKLFWGLSKGKRIKSRQENIGKSDFALLEKFSCYAPALSLNLPGTIFTLARTLVNCNNSNMKM